ncbi:MAG: glycoside hydrolase domain-containing protein [Kiritimatiellia bacterium]
MRPETRPRSIKSRAHFWFISTSTALLWSSIIIVAGQTTAQEINLAGVQVWNVDYWQTVELGDFYGPNYNIRKLKPISLAGCRNGCFAGYVVLTCATGPFLGLKAHATDLIDAAGNSIPASQVKVRYSELARPDTSYAPPYRFDRMLDEPPQEVKTVDLREHRGWKPKNAGPVAMQPVWVTVCVPSNAVPGEYTGKLIIETANNPLPNVTIKITVADWALPDPRHYTVQNIGWLSPERVALYCGVPMWSDQHFQLLGRSLTMMLPLGIRYVEVNLVRRYLSRDNNEVMVTWIKQPDGTFKYDFTVFEKYMDVVAETIGKPFCIRINMWSSRRDPTHPVVVFDPATGQTEELYQPPYGTPESYAFWKPLLDELKARLEKRGWFDAVGVNWHEYCGGPDTNTVSLLHSIWPGTRWADMDHGRRTGFRGVDPKLFVPVIVQSTVWNEGALKPRGYKGKLQPGVAYCGHARNRHSESSTLWDLRAVTEEQIMKGNHGVDPLGGDLWMIQDARGRWVGGQWAACALGPGNCTKAILGPSPKGAVATERYEAFREGVQICEAILFIQRGIDSGKLSPELKARADAVLDERSQRAMDSWVLADKSGRRRFDSSVFSENAKQREHELYQVAADVAAALAGK